MIILHTIVNDDSVYSEEYSALLEGVRKAIQLSNHIINIYTDSLSALNNLKYNFHSSTLAIKIGNFIIKCK